MIKVNLIRNLGASASSGGAAVSGGGPIVSQDLQKQAIYRLLLIIAVTGMLIFYEKVQLAGKQSELDAERAKTEQVRSKREGFGEAGPIVAKYEEQKKQLEAQIKILESITENRLREVKLLDAVQTIIPPKAWLEELKLDQGKVTMTGYAPTEAAALDLNRALDENVLFSNVRVKTEAKEIPEMGPVQRFEFTFQAGKVK